MLLSPHLPPPMAVFEVHKPPGEVKWIAELRDWTSRIASIVCLWPRCLSCPHSLGTLNTVTETQYAWY